MESSVIFAGVLPILLCLITGKLVTYTPVFREFDWSSLEKVMFWIFLPCLIFRSIIIGEFDVSSSIALAFVFVFAQATTALVSFVHAYLAAASAPTLTTLFQNAVRWNNIIPIAMVSSVYGPSGMAIVAVALAVMVPIANISSIIVLEYFRSGHATNATGKFLAVLKNPLILACLAGGAVKLAGVPVFDPVSGTIDILASATLGAGLVIVGASINFSFFSYNRLQIILGAATKLVVMPIIVLICCIAAGIDGVAMAVAVLCGATPTAMQGYIVAKNMGGDAELMGSLIAAEHVLSVITIPLLLFLVLLV